MIIQPIIFVLISFSMIVFFTIKKRFFGLNTFLNSKRSELENIIQSSKQNYENAQRALEETLKLKNDQELEINAIKKSWANRLTQLVDDIQLKEKKQLQFKDNHHQKMLSSLEDKFSKKINKAVTDAVFENLQIEISQINDKSNQNITSQVSKKILTADCSVLDNLFNYD